MSTYIRIICVTFLFLGSSLFACTSNENHRTSESQSGNESESGDFTFVFMTDIHLQPHVRYAHLPQTYEYSPLKAFSMAIDTANQLGADFAMMGGDMVFDVMRGQAHSDSLFQLYQYAIRDFNMPVYHVIGNHELYGIYEESPVSRDHPDFKFGMYERYFGDANYSFDHKGWHFIALNSVDEQNQRYIRTIHEEQIIWLEEHLTKIDRDTPIVITTHIPFISVYNQIYPRDRRNPAPYPGVDNRNDILDLFENHNLKLVLQGHIHWVEDIYIHETDTRFITGGSIAGRPSWRGFRHGPPGFLLITIKDDETISWDFIDYGWMEVIGKPAGWESPR